MGKMKIIIDSKEYDLSQTLEKIKEYAQKEINVSKDCDLKFIHGNTKSVIFELDTKEYKRCFKRTKEKITYLEYLQKKTNVEIKD